jgi:hypothetical protein
MDCGATPKMPICDNGTCRACRAHSDCGSGVCLTDGSCAAMIDVAYVNNTNGAGVTCSDLAHLSTPMNPYCEINRAVLLSGKPYIKVAGSANLYAPVAIMPLAPDTRITLVGPGDTASVLAEIQGPNDTALKLQTDGTNKLRITVDGFVIRGATGANGNGVSCTGSSGKSGDTQLSITRSIIRGNDQIGFVATNCDVTIDRVTVGPSNLKGGVSLASTDFSVFNTLIIKNGSGTADVGGLVFTGSSARAQVGIYPPDRTWTGERLNAQNSVARRRRRGTGGSAMEKSGVEEQWAELLRHRRWTAVEARWALEQWGASGGKLSRFAEEHGVDANRLLRWRTRLGGAEAARKRGTLVPVAVRAAVAAQSAVVVSAGGVRIEVRELSEASRSWVAGLVGLWSGA